MPDNSKSNNNSKAKKTKKPTTLVKADANKKLASVPNSTKANKATKSPKATKDAGRPSNKPAFAESELKKAITSRLLHDFSVQPDFASDDHYYQALALVLRDYMRKQRHGFIDEAKKQNATQVYYMCIEFLVGRSLKNALFNLNLTDVAEKVLKDLGVKLDALYELEPDAGLGNGGLGRLAACFMDGLANASIPAMGYSLLYEYGIFRQKIVDGWQTELPDFWLPGGKAWLLPRPELTKDVSFDGVIREWWGEDGFHHIRHEEANIVKAEAYDLLIPGMDGKAVSTLRLWKSTAQSVDMSAFNQGDYVRAIEIRAMAEAITQVLYPSDNHREGKSLRLSQQYFLVSASVQDIMRRHLEEHATVEGLENSISIHINDTHPTLVIPEMMRILLDECGYSWDHAWEIVTKVVAYTNHTVMSEALETWPKDLVERRLPRIYQIICEINNRFSEQMMNDTGGDAEKVSRMAIISFDVIKMANLCVAAAYSINGVSKLHSEILKDDVFNDAYTVMPEKFTNVTNGIAHRRWLCQANPALTAFITDKIGDGFVRDASELSKLQPYLDDKVALEDFMTIKHNNKVRLSNHVKQKSGIILNPDSIFDAHVKRLHEYKRQLLNAIHILDLYLSFKENPNMEIEPRTYIFAAKAAPGYYLAKQIIKFICNLSIHIDKDPAMKDKLKVVFLENYNVSLAEILMPAIDISEQISLAGTEASGTGNMKLMMNGAVTLGTMDGANVEIFESVGEDNIFIFGLSTDEVDNLRNINRYDPRNIYAHNPRIHRTLDYMIAGFEGDEYSEVVNSVANRDLYMVLADFEDYLRVQRYSSEVYQDKMRWAKMAMTNTAQSGSFSSDRSIRDYATKIWHSRAVKFD